MRIKIKQLASSSSRRLHTRHERLWADEALRLNGRLAALHQNTTFGGDITTAAHKFHGVPVTRLLNRSELEDLRIRAAPLDILNVDTVN